MKPRKLDGAILQDLYHYSLAMRGMDNSVECYTLAARLDTIERAWKLLHWELDAASDMLVNTMYETLDTCREVRHEAEMIALGDKLYQAVCWVAAQMNIEPSTGERIPTTTDELFARNQADFSLDNLMVDWIGDKVYLYNANARVGNPLTVLEADVRIVEKVKSWCVKNHYRCMQVQGNKIAI